MRMIKQTKTLSISKGHIKKEDILKDREEEKDMDEEVDRHLMKDKKVKNFRRDNRLRVTNTFS